MANKEAIVFCVDASRSMKRPWRFGGSDGAMDGNGDVDDGSRLDKAKDLIHRMIVDLMLRSKTHEVGVAVAKTRRTRHHKCPPSSNDDDNHEEYDDGSDVPFPNITELIVNEYGIARPDLQMLYNTDDIHASKSARGGDIGDAVVLAADSLYARTAGKKFKRRIMVFTDCNTEIDMTAANQLPLVIDSLLAMECPIDIVGLDSKLFKPLKVKREAKPTPSSSSIKKAKKTNKANKDGTSKSKSEIKKGKDPKDDAKAKVNSKSKNKPSFSQLAALLDGDGNSDSETDAEDTKEEAVAKKTDGENDSSDTDMGEGKGDDSAIEMDDDETNEDVEQEDDVDDDDDDDDDDDASIDSLMKGSKSFMVGLAEKTGGRVYAIKDLETEIQNTFGKRKVKSTRFTFAFQITPDLILDTARYSLLITKPNPPKIVKKVTITTDADGDVGDSVGNDDTQRTGSAMSQTWGQSQTPAQGNATADPPIESYNDVENFERIYTHWDQENEGQEVTQDQLAQAHRYGSDLVAIGAADLQGLTRRSPKVLKMLGYMDAAKVPREVLISPPYIITGGDSRHACAAISALARALKRMGKVGIGTMVKTKDHHPVLVGVFPLENGAEPIHLMFIQLPFKGDVRDLSALPNQMAEYADRDVPSQVKHEEGCGPNNSETDDDDNEHAKKEHQACDELIDALYLPYDELDYTRIPTPYNMSFHQTMSRRVLDDEARPFLFRRDGADPMATPQQVLRGAKHPMRQFRNQFPLLAVTQPPTDAMQRNRNTYRNYLNVNN